MWRAPCCLASELPSLWVSCVPTPLPEARALQSPGPGRQAGPWCELGRPDAPAWDPVPGCVYTKEQGQIGPPPLPSGEQASAPGTQWWCSSGMSPWDPRPVPLPLFASILGSPGAFLHSLLPLTHPVAGFLLWSSTSLMGI